jgi:hypothetical protein
LHGDGGVDGRDQSGSPYGRSDRSPLREYPMSDLVDRLRVGAGQAKILNREPTAALFHEAADAIEAAEARTKELAEALRELLDVSDSQKSLDIGQTRRTLAKARNTLASPGPPPAPTELSDEDVVKAMVAKTMTILRDGD